MSDIASPRPFLAVENIFLRNLSLVDKNQNGSIDRYQQEGYEEFTAKYGNSDNGYLNYAGIMISENDGQLTPKEIIDHYYLNIRFNDTALTEQIDSSFQEYCLNNSIQNGLIADLDLKEYLSEMLTARGIDLQKDIIELDSTNEILSAIRNAYRSFSFSQPTDTRYTLDLSGALMENTANCIQISLFGHLLLSEAGINSIYKTTSFTDPSYLDRVKLHLFLYIPEMESDLDLTGTINKPGFDPGYIEFVNPVEMIALYLASAARTVNDPERSIELYKEAYQYSQDESYLYNISTYYLELGQFSRAIETLKQLLDNYRQNSQIVLPDENNLAREVLLRSFQSLCNAYILEYDFEGFEQTYNELSQVFANEADGQQLIDSLHREQPWIFRMLNILY